MSYRSLQDVADSVNSFAKVSVSAKERLAKLLASENITVIHDAKYDTAAFDVRDRVLYLPVWKDMSADLYDLFVGHETGHALYTPDGDFFETYTPGQKAYLNVVEDARIENGQKKKFPGLRRPMRAGYSGLVDRKFFGDIDDVSSLPLIDRINLKAKLGTAIDVPFTDDEQATFDRVMSLRCSDNVERNAELFEEARSLAMELWEDARDESQTDTHSDGGRGESGSADDSDESSGDSGDSGGDDSDESSSDSGDDDSGDDSNDSGDDDSDNETSGSGDENGESDSASDSDTDDSGDSNDAGSSGDDDSDSESDDSDDSASDSGSSDDDSSDDDSDNDTSDAASNGLEANEDPTSLTHDSFRENEKSLSEGSDSGDIHLVNLTVTSSSDINPSDHIIYAREHVEASLDTMVHSIRYPWDSDDEERTPSPAAKDEIVQSRRYLDSVTRKGVGVLVKEFEMKKAADASKRAMTDATGTIDTNKLHSYKWNENIFAKNTITPDGKSHGLVIFIDFSGSMSINMDGTIQQLWSLIAFCDRVSIPYDVYSFTSSILQNRSADTGKFADALNRTLDRVMKRPRHERRGTLGSGGDVTLIQLISSRDSKTIRSCSRDVLAGLRSFWYTQYNSSGHSAISIPNWLQLGGTPLNETTLLASRIVNDFRSETGVQLINTVFLTDGAGQRTLQQHGYNTTFVARDPDTRREYIVDTKRRGMGETEALTNILRDRTGSNVVNFFIMNGENRKAFAQVLGIVDGDTLAARREKNVHMTIAGIMAIPTNKEKYDDYRKRGGVTIINSALGYDHQYIVKSDSVDEDADRMDIEAGATKAKLKKAFVKARSGGNMARRVLADFTSIIAV